MNPRRLTRSRDRQLAGVAGGMAEYLDIDPTVIRILWIIVGIASGGLALLAYFILALVMPQAPYAPAPGGWAPAPSGTAGWAPTSAATGAGGWTAPPPSAPTPGWGAPAPTGAWGAGAYGQPAPKQAEGRGIGAAAIVGVVLIVFGAIALVDAAVPGWVAGAIIGPAVVLALGAALLASSLRRRPEETVPAPASAAGPTATPAYATPSIPGMPEVPAAPWDVTDTQSVGPEAPAPAAGTQAVAAPDEDTRPA